MESVCDDHHKFHSSGFTTLTTKSKYRRFNDPAEFDLYVAERGKKNAEGLRALGVPIIDFNVRRRSLFIFASFRLILFPISVLHTREASVDRVRMHAVP